MSVEQVHNVLALEARAERWHAEILAMKRRLADSALAEAERTKLQAEIAGREAELAALDAAIKKRRRALGDVFS